MTIKHDHALCDGGCGAVTPIAGPRFDTWDRIEMRRGAEAHLCEQCRYKRDHGSLLEYVRECVRCGRNTKDNPQIKQWWGTREDRSASVCDDCFEPDRDTTNL